MLNAVHFTRDPVGFLERQRRRYGDVFSLNFPGFGRMVYFAEPETVKQIFTGDPATLHAGEANGARARAGRSGKFSLLTLDGTITCASASCCCRPSTASACGATRT